MTTPGAAAPLPVKGAAPAARRSRFRGASWFVAAPILALAGCIIVPTTQTVYDRECQVHTRQVVLQTAVIGGFHSCAGDACAAMLATMGIITAASVVVSGSIAIVGNVVYFLEKQGRCMRGQAGAAPPPRFSPPV